MRVAVIGAGPAGITAAHQLAKRGAEVQVFESDGEVGGMSRTFELWGQKVDIGPHRFFSNDTRVNRLWLDVMGSDYRMVERLTRIYYRKRFFHYPLKPYNALKNMGIVNAALCLSSYLKQKCVSPFQSADLETFEAWVVDRFGRRLFEMFFKTYSEKLWGISCKELDSDFAAQRIKKFSMGSAIKSLLGLDRQKHHTLVDTFAYPVGGTGMVYERMARDIRAAGGKIHLNRPVECVVHENRKVKAVKPRDGAVEPFDHVISTMPITQLVQGLGEAPREVQAALPLLKYRNTVLIYLHVEGKNLFPDQWLYVHSDDLGMGRITNFRNWVPEINGDSGNTILALEYWCYDDDEMWAEDSSTLIELAAREIRATGLIGDAAVLDGHVIPIKRSYPVYSRGYRQHLDPIVSYLQSFDGLTPIGRNGAFKYNNQDHSILMGLLAAENIAEGKKHDLWAVNTDDSYQESSRITETGLVSDSRQPETLPLEVETPKEHREAA